MSQSPQEKKKRRTYGFSDTITTNYLNLRNPWVIAWWSAAFPGFGHHMVGRFLSGWILMLWELGINIKGQLNTAIIYSFTGHLEKVAAVTTPQYLCLYATVYLFSIWDSYRLAVEGNKQYILASNEDAPIRVFNLGALGVNYLDKKKPWLAAAWSMLLPGIGHLYVGNLPSAIFGLFWSIFVIYFSNAFQCVYFTLIGDFQTAKTTVNWQYLLFLPSIYGYSAYYAHSNASATNRLFEKEQALFLRNEYQSAQFEMPI